MSANTLNLHVIQEGETLSDIAQKYGVTSQDLRSFHNANAPLGDLMGTTENFTNDGQLSYVAIPPEEERTSTSSIIEESSETENNFTGNSEENQEENQETSQGEASEHDQKYVVIQKGYCVCDQSIPPNMVPVQFKVDSHQLQHANGEEQDHLIVTDEDVFFQKSSQPFGPQCKLQPNSSSYNPCSYAPAGKWQKTYSKIQVQEKAVLTELSELQCAIGGKITVFQHGQSQKVTNAHFGNVELEELQAISPLAEKPELERPIVEQIQAKLPSQNNKTKSGTSEYKKPEFKKGSSDGVAEITVRVDESVEFSVIKYKNEAKADKSRVSWKVLKGFDWVDETTIQYSNFGETLKVNFDVAGKYRVFAFGNEDRVKQADNRCALDVHVVINQLNKSTKGIETVGNHFSGKDMRRGFPVNFQPDFELPATQEELARVEMGVKDAQGNVVESNFSPSTGLIFTPNNAIKYKVWIRYTQQDGTVQSFENQYEAKPNVVNAIQASPSAEKFRPGTTIQFTVSKMRFSPIDNDPDLDQIKWNVNGVTAPERGKNFSRRFDQTGKYMVEAFMKAADGEGTDTFSFDIVNNQPESFKGGNSVNWIVGKWYEMELESIFPFDKSKDGDLTYKSLLTGHIEIKEAKGNKVKIRAVKPIVAPLAAVSATMGGKTITLIVLANYAQIKRWCITDQDLDFKSDAGWSEELFALVETDPILAGEKVHLHLLELDDANDSNYIKDLGEVSFDEKGIVKAKFTTNEIKSELNKLYNERGNYELFFAADYKESGIQFADMSRKNRGGKNTVYPAKTVSHTQLEKAKITYIDSKKDITSVRFLKPNGKDAYEVIKYGETINLKVQTRNLEGSKLKLTLIRNKFGNGLDKIPQDTQVTVKNEMAEWTINTATLKNKIPKDDWNKIAFWQVEIEEADGDKVKYPKENARLKDGSIDWTKLMTFQSLKLSEKPELSELAKTHAPLVVGVPMESTSSSTGVCVCREYDLIWGNKVSCEFRKKVVEIAKELWLSDYLNMANNLMAVFAWESGGTFKAGVPNQANSGGTGLIQFMPDTAEILLGKEITIEYTSDFWGKKLKRVKEFAEMTEIKQLDYVKKYFEPLKNKKVEFVDFYLQVLFPASSLKEDHIVFANSLDKITTRLNESEKLRNLRVKAYSQNSGLDSNSDGKVWKSEIQTKVQKYITEGESQKTSKFYCLKDINRTTPNNSSKWHHPVKNPQLRGSYAIWDPNRSIHSDNVPGRSKGKHDGIDLYAPEGTELYACVDGEIYDPYFSDSYGNTITIKGDYDGITYYFFYAHLKEAPNFKAGDKIKAGDTIGFSGKTGSSASNLKANQVHLHFEVRTKGTRTGNRVDPFTTIRELDNEVEKNPKESDQS